MPVATIMQPTERFELKTLEGGYVVVKRMTYGQKLTRQEMAMKMRIKGDNKRDMATEVDMMNRKIALWSFSNLVEEHNLTDENGRELNFKNAADVDKLQGQIGEEIESYIDKINNFEDEAADSSTELGN